MKCIANFATRLVAEKCYRAILILRREIDWYFPRFVDRSNEQDARLSKYATVLVNDAKRFLLVVIRSRAFLQTIEFWCSDQTSL